MYFTWLLDASSQICRTLASRKNHADAIAIGVAALYNDNAIRRLRCVGYIDVVAGSALPKVDRLLHHILVKVIVVVVFFPLSK